MLTTRRAVPFAPRGPARESLPRPLPAHRCSAIRSTSATRGRLPWDGTNAWWQGRADYNLQNLVADTEALLTPSTPVIVRMETLRRAALYASLDEQGRRTAAVVGSPPVQSGGLRRAHCSTPAT